MQHYFANTLVQHLWFKWYLSCRPKPNPNPQSFREFKVGRGFYSKELQPASTEQTVVLREYFATRTFGVWAGGEWWVRVWKEGEEGWGGGAGKAVRM